ncbi:MAG: hypothetical protein ACI8RZ_007753 [Myxococcota bacterium]|jgi:hypothetical protein
MNRSTLGLFAALTGLSFYGLDALAGAKASSFKSERKRGENYFNANSATDGNPQTAWLVPGESENKGEWIMIDVPKLTIDKLGMNIGYALSDDTFQDYARIKSVSIELFQYSDLQDLEPVPGQVTATFEDKAGFQIIDVDNMEITSDSGGKVKITVTEVYPGRDYPNFGISEMLIYPTEFEVATSINDVSDESGDHSRLDLIDDSSRTFWAADAEGASISCEVSGYTISSIGIQPGPSSYSRPKTVKLTAGPRQVTVELANNASVQWFDIPSTSGFSGYWADVTVEVLEVYPGSNPQVAIAELDLKAVAYAGF